MAGEEEQRFKSLTIDGWRQFRSINIEFHPQLTIITGANGSGKSTLLHILSRHFGYNRNFLATPYAKNGVRHFSAGLFDWLKRVTGLGKPPERPDPVKIGEIGYGSGAICPLRVPRGDSLQYQISIDSQKSFAGVHIDSHRAPSVYRNIDSFPTIAITKDQIANELNSELMNHFSSGNVQRGSLYHIKRALICMSIFGHGNSTMEPIPELLTLFSGFEETLRKVLPKPLGFNRFIIRSPEIVLSTNSGDFLIDAASGGVIKVIEVAWQIYFYSQMNSRFVLTMDEPENHLHPAMQREFLNNFTVAFPGAQMIVVTHSPFMISSMKDSSVYVLRFEETDNVQSESDEAMHSHQTLKSVRVVSERLDTVNKAGTAAEILREALGVPTTIPDWAEERVREIINSRRGQPVTSELLKALHIELEREGLASRYPVAVQDLTESKQ